MNIQQFLKKYQENMVDFETDIKNAINALERGGAILYPTDTVWGIGCDATDEKAVAKIFSVKKRAEDKSLIVLLADPRDILQYVAAPPPDIIDILATFDRPTTVIYENALGFPANLVHEDGSVAIRVTGDPFCKALIKRFRKPLVSTSANISGMPTPSVFSEVDEQIIAGVDYVVNYRQDDDEVRAPSRLIRISDDGTIKILRD